MQSIGQTLKQAREDQRITLDKASEVTRIRVAYLQALEADDHSVLPSPVQARGFLRNYAEYLGLNFDQLIESQRVSRVDSDEIIGPMDLTAETESQASDLLSTSQTTPLSTPEPVSVPQSDSLADDESQSEPVTDTLLESPVEISRSESRDATWQTWLNRVGKIVGESREPDETVETSSEESVEESTQQPLTESDQIFIEIGAELRQRRELLSLHLDEVERNTHVKAHYLEALEKGAMQDLPSTVQTRGMLSNYASFLDLDVDVLLLRYADALQARHREKNPQRVARKPGQPIVSNLPPLRSFIAGDMIFGVGVAIILIVFSVWGINWVLTVQSQKEVQPTAPSISDVLLATPEIS